MKTFDKTHASNDSQNGVYFRLHQNPSDGLISVITLQYFDELDYDETKFVKNSEGERYWFENEEDAISQLNDWYEQEEIDEEFRLNKKQDTFLTR